MEIINVSELTNFADRHSNARKPITNWIAVAKAAEWKNFADVRQTFRSADYVKDQVVFDVGGNNYRLVTSVDYFARRVFVLYVMTHSEYDRWKA